VGYQADLLAGVAQLLADAGVATWSPTGVYATGQTGIVLGGLTSTPAAQVVLSTYPVSDDPASSDVVTGLQVLTRGDSPNPTSTSDLTDAVYDQLQGLHGHTLAGGVRIVHCTRRSGADLGTDSDGRHRESSNYYVTAHRPSPHRE
jgi:hypothetical protein